MPTAVVDLMQSYDQSDVAMESVADGIHMISPVDTPLQLMLTKVQGRAVQEKWIEDELLPQKSTSQATIANTTATTVTFATGDGAKCLPNDVASFNSIIMIDQEAMLVTAISTDTATVTRGHGSTTKATHAADAPIHVIGHLETEGADAKKAWSTARTKPSNYHQTFSRKVEVSGVQEAIEKLGGIRSEVDYQILMAMRHLALELEKTLLYGPADAAGDATTPRTMGGLWHMVATNRTSDSGSIDEDAIEADIETIWTAGGTPNVIITTGKLAQDISKLYSDRIRTDIINTVGGVNVTAIVDVLSNGPLFIIPHRGMMVGQYFMLDMTRIALSFLRPFFMKPLAEAGDMHERWIGGDYTLEVMNETAHAYRYGFTE